MHLLESLGLIVLDCHRHIKLTPAGQTLADKLYDRQRLLETLLISLGVSAQTAAIDACRLEHALSEESFAKLKTRSCPFPAALFKEES